MSSAPEVRPWGDRIVAFVRAWAALVCVIAAIVAAAFWLRQAPSSRLTIRADLEVSGGLAVELFLNNFDTPLRAPLGAGRRAYEFAADVPAVDLLRLDPADASDVEVRIHGIELLDAGRNVLARYSPEAIAQWTTMALELVRRQPDMLVMRSTSGDPMLIGHVSRVVVPAPASVRDPLVARLHRDPWIYCALVLPLLALIELRPFKSWLLRVAGAAVVIAIWPPIYQAVVALDWGPTPSGVTISKAAFLGISLPSIQAAVAAAFLAAGLIGLVAALWRALPTTQVAVEVLPAGTTRFLAVMGAAAVVFAAPDLTGVLSLIKTTQFPPHWDYDNILYWSYWTAQGALPFRDFWFPYGGFFLNDLPWPTGPLIGWVAAACRLWVFIAALVLASGARRWPAIAAAIALTVAEGLGLHFATERYLLGVNVVLAYVAAQRWGFRGWLPLVPLTTAISMTLVLETAQLIYAAPGVVAIAALDIIRRRQIALSLRGFVCVGGALLATAIPLLAVLASNGMLAEAWKYYAKVGDVVQYAALPASIPPTPWPGFPIGSVVVWYPAVVLMVALVELRRSDPQAQLRACALAGLAVLTFLVLQKHLVRPIPDTLMLFVLVAGLVFGALSPRRSYSRVGVGAVVGLSLAVMMLRGNLETTIRSAVHVPARVAGNLRVLASPETLTDANQSKFAPERFALHRPQRQLVDQLTQRRGGRVRLFALSDDPVLYLLTGQPVSWHANLYNGSPVYEQRRVIQDLLRARPDFVVMHSGRMAFDEVLLVVRIPDIVAHIVSNFVPDAPALPYFVLRPRYGDDPVTVSAWKAVFGSIMDLGMIPARLGESVREPCATSNACDEELVLTPTGPVTGASTWVSLTVGDLTVNVRVHLRPDRSRYVIPLSRLWPAAVARTAGLKVEATSEAGFSLERTTAARNSGRVY